MTADRFYSFAIYLSMSMLLCFVSSTALAFGGPRGGFNRNPTPGIDFRTDVLLTIDVGGPSAVRFSAADGFSLLTFGRAEDIELIGFFTSDAFFTSPIALTGDLAQATSGERFDTLDIFRFPNNLKLNFENLSSTEDFIDGELAFIGASTADLSGAPLPSAGTIGDIFTAFSGTKIGQYEVVSTVPSPTAGVMGFLALAGIMASRRRR